MAMSTALWVAPAKAGENLGGLKPYPPVGITPPSLDQVTSVSQLADVQPTDWAFQALQSLVERYGVIAGYPDGKFRGNRALTRYEFAAGLNAALDRVNELIASGTADLVTKEDLATLQKLQEEFSAELATLRGRVDALEARTAKLEAQQFSTTTKLAGEAIFAVTDVISGDNSTQGDTAPAQNTVFVNRVRLNFNTSFTGNDLL
ncbi:MAG: iron uptake porin, partial [Leptolyngbyaceae bacterium]|nr:iron uptake porin [Leptolyngbyaceae bacterium]